MLYLFLAGLGWGSLSLTATPPAEPLTVTYKRVGPLEIKADVYLPTGGLETRPVVVYLHGGSLINGSRTAVQRWAPLKDLLGAGVVVVSVDYRLAPETKLPEIITDIEDAFRWVRGEGPALFKADPGRVGVAGASAGGYLALAAGHRVTPAPRVVLAEMGYVDLIGSWQLEPSRHPPHYEDSDLSPAEAWKQVAGGPIANGDDREGDGGAFNDFIRRTAQWPWAVSGWDPRSEADRFTPYLPLRNLNAGYPPTFLIHGLEDSDVPFEQSRKMAAELARHGVECRLVGIHGAEHGFRGADPQEVASARADAVRFVIAHLGSPSPEESDRDAQSATDAAFGG